MKYAVQRMTEANYNKYMSGGHGYDVQTLWVEAETPQEAAEAAKEVGYVVNERYVRTADELEAEREAEKARVAAIEARDAAAKAKREATEARKAAEAGLTVAEYRKAKAGCCNKTSKQITTSTFCQATIRLIANKSFFRISHYC